MKGALCVLAGVVLLMVCTVRGEENNVPAPRFTRATVEQTEQSLVQALESNSPGLHVSAAQTARDLKTLMPERSFSRLAIPLMRIVKDEGAESCARVVAAMALHELHSAIGDFAIAREVIFSDCPKMRHICSWLTYYQWLENHPESAGTVVDDPNNITMGFGK